MFWNFLSVRGFKTKNMKSSIDILYSLRKILILVYIWFCCIKRKVCYVYKCCVWTMENTYISINKIIYAGKIWVKNSVWLSAQLARKGWSFSRWLCVLLNRTVGHLYQPQWMLKRLFTNLNRWVFSWLNRRDFFHRRKAISKKDLWLEIIVKIRCSK